MLHEDLAANLQALRDNLVVQVSRTKFDYTIVWFSRTFNPNQ